MQRRRPVAVCAAGAIAVSMAGSAIADDATLRAKINELRPTFDADGQAFSQALSGPVNQDTLNRVFATANKLIQDADGARATLGGIPASTRRVAKGRTLLIKSLGQLSAGLKQLEASLSASSNGTAKKKLKSAEALLAKSDRGERRAEKLIGAKIS
jgi:hypothetical protein